MKKVFAILGALAIVAGTATASYAAVRIDINNDATVRNNTTANAETGENSQRRITTWSLDTIQDGRNDILTGDAQSTASNLNVTNKTELSIRNSIQTSRASKMSEREEDCDCAEVDVRVKSLADVKNDTEALADTGDNEQKMKLDDVEVADQNGENIITTGVAITDTVNENYTNTVEAPMIEAEVFRVSRDLRGSRSGQ